MCFTGEQTKVTFEQFFRFPEENKGDFPEFKKTGEIKPYWEEVRCEIIAEQQEKSTNKDEDKDAEKNNKRENNTDDNDSDYTASDDKLDDAAKDAEEGKSTMKKRQKSKK